MITLVRMRDVRSDALKEGDDWFYYIAKNCPLWYSDMDIHYSELSLMKVIISNISKKKNNNMIKVEVFADNTDC
jgi:hypothetical protein